MTESTWTVGDTASSPDLASPTEGMSIEFIEVTKKFDNSTIAVDSVDLTVDGGEFIALLGPSGCGKSTLLRLICGLESVTSGEIYLNGKLSNYERPKNRDVAMVFQNYALYPHMTIEKNLGFPLSVAHISKSEVSQRVHEVAAFVELEEHLKKYPDQLSGGQRQRVALGRAIIRQPGAFLMDEPLSNLDALLRVQMRTELLRLHKRLGRTTIYVTHDQTEAMTMADRIVVMRLGVVQQIGSPDDLYNEPANTFVATFVGSPQMNLFEGTVSMRDGKPCFETPELAVLNAALPQNTPAGEVSVGIRPEDIVLCGAGDAGAIEGRVELCETVGPDSYLTIDFGEHCSAQARVPAGDRVTEGNRVSVQFRPGRARFFGSDGKALKH